MKRFTLVIALLFSVAGLEEYVMAEGSHNPRAGACILSPADMSGPAVGGEIGYQYDWNRSASSFRIDVRGFWLGGELTEQVDDLWLRGRDIRQEQAISDIRGLGVGLLYDLVTSDKATLYGGIGTLAWSAHAETRIRWRGTPGEFSLPGKGEFDGDGFPFYVVAGGEFRLTDTVFLYTEVTYEDMHATYKWEVTDNVTGSTVEQTRDLSFGGIGGTVGLGMKF
jgi:hypothetical protein